MKATKAGLLGLVVVAAIVGAVLVTGIPAGFLLDVIQKQVDADGRYKLSGNTKLSVWPLSIRIDNFSVVENGSRLPPPLKADNIRLSIPFSSVLSGNPQVSEAAIARPVLTISLDRSDAADRPAPKGSASRKGVLPRRVTVEDASIVLSERGRREMRFDHVAVNASATEVDGRSELVVAAKWQDHALRIETALSPPFDTLDGRPLPVKILHEHPGAAALAVTAEGKLSGPTFALNNIEGNIGGDRFDGWASVRFSRVPSVTADVHFHRLTIPPLWPAGSDTAIGAPWSDQALDFDALNFFDAAMKISAAELTFDSFRAGPIATETTIEKGVLTESILEAQINDGRASGRLVVDASQPSARSQLQLDLADVRAGPIVSAFTGSHLVEGLMVARMDLSGEGNSARQIASSLRGEMDLALRDGEIPGINIADMVRTLAAQTLKGWQNKGVEKTDFTSLNARLLIDGGRAETQNISLLGPFVRVTGKGQIDFAQKTLDLKFEPKVVLSMQGQNATDDPVGLGVPVAVEGPWQEPRIYPDIAGIFDNPDEAFSKLNALGGGLFGGKDGKSGGMFDSLGQSFDRLLGGEKKQGEGASGNPAQRPAEGGKSPNESSSPGDILKQLFGR